MDKNLSQCYTKPACDAEDFAKQHRLISEKKVEKGQVKFYRTGQTKHETTVEFGSHNTKN